MTTDAELSAVANRLVELASEAGDATVRVTRNRHGLTRFAGSSIHQHVGEDTTSATLRLVRDGRAAEASTTRTDERALADLVERTARLADTRPPDDLEPGPAPAADVADLDHVADSTVAATPDDRARGVAAFVEKGPGLDAAGYLDTESLTMVMRTSAGQEATASRTRATIDGIHRDGLAAGGGHQTARALTDLDAAAAGARAAVLARDSVGASDVDPGDYEVVLGPEAVATMAVFLGFYGFSAKRHQEGQSFVEVGERQFDAAITLRDDVTHPQSCGLAVDAEGTPKQPVRLVEGGVARGLVHDRRTAGRAGAESTGHAIPGGAAMGPMPTDLVLEGGDHSPDELVAGVDRGLYVRGFHYCRVLDPKTIGVTGLTRNGTFLIEGGEIARPVTDLRFTESFVDALGPGRVLGVGNDERYADSEFGAGIAIAPSLRLASWRFTGGARG